MTSGTLCREETGALGRYRVLLTPGRDCNYLCLILVPVPKPPVRLLAGSLSSCISSSPTGSPRVGKIIMKAAATHLTPVTLELGGKNPCYVADQCNLQNVANRIVWGRFFNAGQSCIAPDYVLCTLETQEKLLPVLRHAINDFYGAEPKESPDYARIINDKQFQRLQALMNGGRVAIGGQTDAKERYIGEGP